MTSTKSETGITTLTKAIVGMSNGIKEKPMVIERDVKTISNNGCSLPSTMKATS